jgi:hypothetical protein
MLVLTQMLSRHPQESHNIGDPEMGQVEDAPTRLTKDRLESVEPYLSCC